MFIKKGKYKWKPQIVSNESTQAETGRQKAKIHSIFEIKANHDEAFNSTVICNVGKNIAISSLKSLKVNQV
jgi:hypothetical protein